MHLSARADCRQHTSPWRRWLRTVGAAMCLGLVGALLLLPVAPAAALREIKFSYGSGLCNMPLFYAGEKQLFRKDGIEGIVVMTPMAGDSAIQLATGQVDMGVIPYTNAIAAYTRCLRLRWSRAVASRASWWLPSPRLPVSPASKGRRSALLRDNTLIAGWNMPTYLLNADWSTYGHVFTVAGILLPSGTALDNTMLMTPPAARRPASTRAAWQAQPREERANHGAPGREATPGMLPDDAVSALLIRTAGGVDLQDMAVRLTRLDRDLEVLAAPAYVQTLRQSLRRVRRLVELCGFTMLLAVYLSIAALRRSRQSRAIGIQSGPQAV